MLPNFLSLCLLLAPPNAAPSTAPTAPGKPVPQNAAPSAPATNTATSAAARPDQWWIDRNNSFNARAKQGAANGDIDIIFVGDSITQGWEGEGKEVWAKEFAPRHAVNCGIGGDRTQHVLYRMQNGNLDGLAKPAKGSAPRLVVLMIGTNNTSGGPGVANSPTEINQGVRADVLAIHEKLPMAHILVLGIFPRSEKPDAQREAVAETNKLLSTIGKSAGTDPGMPSVHYLDISDRFREKDGTISKEIMPDFLHLSPKGYQIWADAIAPEIDKCAPSK